MCYRCEDQGYSQVHQNLMTAPGKLTGCEENFATLLAKVCVISVVACVAAVSFPFPKKACEGDENCERLRKRSRGRW